MHRPQRDSSRPIREQDGWDEHAAFMDGLVDQGFVVTGGPLGPGERVLLIVEAADKEAIRQRLNDDPWEHMGLLRVGQMEPWTVWLDGRKKNGVAD